MRPITNDDIWACIRGCELNKLTYADLVHQLEQHNAQGPEWTELFAGRVYGEALRQTIALKKTLLSGMEVKP